MPERFLVLQSSYKVLTIGICENGRITDRSTEAKLTTSASLVPLAIQLLERNSLSLKDLSGIIIDQGPGAFGSLRVLLSTANAVGFALKLPLIGVDGLNTLAHDVIDNYTGARTDENILLVTMLNAYSVECYYGLYEVNLAQRKILQTFDRSYMKVYTLIELLIKRYPQHKQLFVGNGVPIYGHMIMEQLGDRSTCINDAFDLASIDTIAHYGFKQWQTDQNRVYRLMPLYLKMQMYTSAPSFNPAS